LPLGGHSIKIGRTKRRMAVAAEIAVALVVGKNDDEIWRPRLSGWLRRFHRSGRQRGPSSDQGEKPKHTTCHRVLQSPDRRLRPGMNAFQRYNPADEGA